MATMSASKQPRAQKPEKLNTLSVSAIPLEEQAIRLIAAEYHQATPVDRGSGHHGQPGVQVWLRLARRLPIINTSLKARILSSTWLFGMTPFFR